MMWKLIAGTVLLPLMLWAAEPHYVVAFAQDTMDNDYRIAQVKEVEETLKPHKNIRFVYSDAKGNHALMLKQIEAFVAKGVDLIITSPNHEIAVVPAIESAYEKGIPVILLDRGVQSDRYTTFIRPDNRLIAASAAEYMAKKMGYKGTVLMLKGVPNADVTRERTEAFTKVIGTYKGMKIVERTGNFLRRDAILAMESVEREGISYDAIFSQSDSMLSGVRLYFKKRGINPADYLMVGIDYISETRKAIRRGEQDSSFVYSLCGKEGAEAAVAILEGKKVPKEIILETRQVTRENVDDVKPIF
jgi:ABC-type sugar transport system substrate-binding protein